VRSCQTCQTCQRTKAEHGGPWRRLLSPLPGVAVAAWIARLPTAAAAGFDGSRSHGDPLSGKAQAKPDRLS
jgi:hypothetical protein